MAAARSERATSKTLPPADKKERDTWEHLPFANERERVEHKFSKEFIRLSKDFHEAWAAYAEGWEESEFNHIVSGSCTSVWSFVYKLNGNSNWYTALVDYFLRGTTKCDTHILCAWHHAAERACEHFIELKTKKPVTLYRFCHNAYSKDEFVIFRSSSASKKYMETHSSSHRDRKPLELAVFMVAVGVPLLPTLIFQEQSVHLTEFEVLLPPRTLAKYELQREINLKELDLGEPLKKLLKAVYVVRPKTTPAVSFATAHAGAGGSGT